MKKFNQFIYKIFLNEVHRSIKSIESGQTFWKLSSSQKIDKNRIANKTNYFLKSKNCFKYTH